MGHIFISYSRQNKEQVLLVIQQLREAGLDIWIDENDIPAGTIVPQEIASAILGAEKFFLFLSPAATLSPYVQGELNLALGRKMKTVFIVPVLLIPFEIPPEFVLQIGSIERVDLTLDLNKGVSQLIKLAGGQATENNIPILLESLARNTHTPNVTYITPDLISPYEETTRNVVIGKTISIDHICDQRFMSRSERVSHALHELDLLLHERNRSDDEMFFTFWIHGRSGSGKSVLLLQLMQTLILQRNAKVFWLDDANEALQLLLEKWAEQAIYLDEPVFIFVDDFNTPQTRDLIDYKPLVRLLRNPKYARVDWPVIVTCSPPEYLADFQSAGKNEGFRIRSWEIPTFSTAEAVQLTQWFEHRTGEKPIKGPAFQQSEGLAMSMMFELWYGAHHQIDIGADLMAAFGRRFKERLESLNLVDVITPILALNRLYILAPKSWLDELSAEQKDALNSLNRDQDFSILSAEQRGGTYIRLTHPHLSNTIYKAIRPDNKKITRAEDLALAFGRTLTAETLIASRILRTIADGNERVSVNDLDMDTLALKFSRTWLEKRDAVDDIIDNRSLAYFWTNWAAWNAVYPALSSYLDEPTIIEKAVVYLGFEHRFWGVLWQTLWHCAPENPILSETALNWLLGTWHRDDPSWSFVWQVLLEHPKELPVGVSVERLIEQGVGWLGVREDKDQWSFVWRCLLEHPKELPVGVSVETLIEQGVEWLAGREDKDQWSFVWRCLLEYPKELPVGVSVEMLIQQGVEWLGVREDKDQWSFVWHCLLEHPKELPVSISVETLIQQGVEWLGGRENKDQWSFVWHDLLKHPKELPVSVSIEMLIEQGVEWLVGREDQDQWSFVWQTVFHLKDKSFIPVNHLLEVGTNWLQGHKERKDWNYIWRDILQSQRRLGNDGAIKDLVSLGLSVLELRDENEQWTFIWQILLQSSNDLPVGVSVKMLVQQGIEWLAGREDKDQWSFVWQVILEHPQELPVGVSVEMLIQQGVEWLANREDKDQWSFVWQVLLEHPKELPVGVSVETLIEQGVEWLAGREDKDQWSFGWQVLLKHSKELPVGVSVETLIEQGVGWLAAGREDKDQWSFVWRCLLAHPKELPVGVSVETLIEQGVEWLVGREDKDQWSFVWQVLLKHSKELPVGVSVETLIEQGVGWLAGREDKDQWSFVWQTLLKHSKELPVGVSVERLIEQGVEWLGGREDKDHWNFVWQILLEHPKEVGVSTETLIQQGVEWLAGRDDKDQWDFIWQTLLEHPKELPVGVSVETLIEQGVEWLAGREDKDPWAFVWQTLLEYPKELPIDVSIETLIKQGVEWLAGREDKGQWSFIWQVLLKHPNELPIGISIEMLIEQGAVWLAGREDKDQWNFVWQILLKHSKELPVGVFVETLIEQGVEWLAGREDKDQWSFVWQILLKHPKELPTDVSVETLIEQGVEWLMAIEDNDSWSNVFEVCLRSGIANPKILSLGVEWLIQNTTRPDAIGIALEIAKHSEKLDPKERNALQSCIKDWVYKVNYKNPQWTFGWDAYWEIMPTIQVVDLALTWIKANPENIGSAYWLINKLFKSRRPDVLRRVDSWHKEHPKHPVAKYIEEKFSRIPKADGQTDFDDLS